MAAPNAPVIKSGQSVLPPLGGKFRLPLTVCRSQPMGACHGSRFGKKVLSLDQKREAVTHLVETESVPAKVACEIIDLHRAAGSKSAGRSMTLMTGSLRMSCVTVSRGGHAAASASDSRELVAWAMAGTRSEFMAYTSGWA
jgi:hypothetical protein